MLYREFADAEAIDREYNLVQAVPDAGAIAEAWATRSEEARAALDGALGVRYGPTREEYVDVFPPTGAGPSPVHVFIHGGYWRRFSARDFSFVARPLAARGAGRRRGELRALSPGCRSARSCASAAPRSPGSTTASPITEATRRAFRSRAIRPAATSPRWRWPPTGRAPMDAPRI